MRKSSQETFGYWLSRHGKTVIFCAIAVAVIKSIVCAEYIVFHVYLQPSSVAEIHTSKILIKTAVTDVLLHSEQKGSSDVDNEKQNSLLPPFNITEEERIKWFRKRLPEFEILKSDSMTQEFHSRVIAFFNNDCEVQFFMTWISPAEFFGRREFMALESLFKVHPHGCLVLLSRTMDSEKGHSILKPLIDLGFKVTAVTPNLSFLFNNTPAGAWFDELKRGKKDPGETPLSQNLSNIIRLAVLHRYGGVYLDTDFIVLRSFKDLRNSIGAQSDDVVSKKWTRLNNAVLVFDRNHALLLRFIEEFAASFDGNKWGHNGPYLVSRVVRRIVGSPGYNFSVLPPMAFYPVDWTRISRFFERPEDKAASRWVEAKLLQISVETYGVHLQKTGYATRRSLRKRAVEYFLLLEIPWF
uniref:Uncharacterized protein MANES_08G090400 n=1 Tax=Rhizophora mucronata TaxID=61149 RepID=A0A2P2J294_RHIMU